MGSTQYFVNAYEANLFMKRYKNPGTDESTWEEAFSRVARAVGTSEEQIKDFTNMMCEGIALPSSPQIWNLGSTRGSKWQASSCFTGRLGDSIDDFIKCDTHAHSVYMSSGGFGVLANDIRSRGCKISYSNSMSVGAMGMGGPVRRLEKTTGYITNGGRDRGALMVQLSASHPDTVEFVLSKIPVSLGFLDDWPANAMHHAAYADNRDSIERVVQKYASDWVFGRKWPSYETVVDYAGPSVVMDMIGLNILRRHNGTLVPMVFDWYSGTSGAWRDANRDWDLPLQNCNISTRINGAVMIAAAERGDNWVFSWFSKEAPKPGQKPWTLTDIGGGGLRHLEDGEVIRVDYSNNDIQCRIHYPEDHANEYRYGVVITTWEGLKENLKPNPNNWKDIEYARFYRKVLMPTLEKYSGPIMAQQVLNIIFEAAHDSADPGVVFEDTYEKFNPICSATYGERLANPCAEFLEAPFGSCNLISGNLRWCYEQVNDISDEMISIFGDTWNTDGLSTAAHWELLRDSNSFNEFLKYVNLSASKAFEYISETHEKNVAPVQEIQEMSHKHYRTVGVGIMGLAEALMAFHVRYGSECGTMVAAAAMAEVYTTCWEGSFDLASKGWPVPLAWNQPRMEAIFGYRADYAKQYKLGARHKDRINNLMTRIRNGEQATNTCVTSVAPTGTISQIAGWLLTRRASNGVLHHKVVSSSGEPTYSWVVGRLDNSGKTEIVHDLYMSKEHNGKPWMVTSAQVSAEGHVYMQAAISAFCCMAVSKTINMSEMATVEDVANGYITAWKMGIPGTTIYRDRSKPMQVLTALECPSGDCKVSYADDVNTPTEVNLLTGK